MSVFTPSECESLKYQVLTLLSANPDAEFAAAELADAISSTGVTGHSLSFILRILKTEGLIKSNPKSNISLWSISRDGTTDAVLAALGDHVGAAPPEPPLSPAEILLDNYPEIAPWTTLPDDRAPEDEPAPVPQSVTRAQVPAPLPASGLVLRPVAWTLGPHDCDIFDDKITRIEIDDEGGGEYLTISQISESDRGKVKFDPLEIESLIAGLRAACSHLNSEERP